MIYGVKTKPLRIIPDERGRLMEILRMDDEVFMKFGQVYLTSAYPGVVKGWHFHKVQYDNMVVIRGMMKIVLYDSRETSSSFGEVNEYFLGEHNYQLLHIPPFVFHGFKCISEHEALVINIPTEVYDYAQPDEFRVHPHLNDIPYEWNRKDG